MNMKRKFFTDLLTIQMIKIELKLPLILFVLFGIYMPSIAQQPSSEYRMVDVRTKVYVNDGSRHYTEYQANETRTVDLLRDFKKEEGAVDQSKYGGWLEHKEEATGFFHVKKIDERWWGIDPSGYRYFNMALNSINEGKSENNIRAFKEKFGESEIWIEKTLELLQDNGFNGAGSWSDVEAIRLVNEKSDNPFSYTINWNFMSSYGKKRGGTFQVPGHTGYPNSAIFLFDPEFEIFCDEHAQQLLETKDDPNLFAYFSDNELPFQLQALDNYLRLPKGDHGRVAAEKFLLDRGIVKKRITDEDREQFLALVGDRYFSIVSKAIKKYDPNHLFIGSRFYGNEKSNEAFIRSTSKYLDTVSFNYYGAWTPSAELMANWTRWAEIPFLVTEYYAKGEDSGLPNMSGAGFIVKTQEDRGLFYQNFNLALLESNNCIGWHYFKYQDNDPSLKDAEPSNIDSNKGIVDQHYNPWIEMLDKMKELNQQVYNIIKYFDSL